MYMKGGGGGGGEITSGQGRETGTYGGIRGDVCGRKRLCSLSTEGKILSRR